MRWPTSASRPSTASSWTFSRSNERSNRYSARAVRNLHSVKTIPAALHVPELADEQGLIHGFSTTLLGSVGLTHAPDKEPVLAARRSFMQVMGVEDRILTTAGALHGAAVARINDPRGLVN